MDKSVWIPGKRMDMSDWICFHESKSQFGFSLTHICLDFRSWIFTIAPLLNGPLISYVSINDDGCMFGRKTSLKFKLRAKTCLAPRPRRNEKANDQANRIALIFRMHHGKTVESSTTPLLPLGPPPLSSESEETAVMSTRDSRTSCPTEILEFLSTKVGAQAVQHVQIQELQSAQQQVLLLSLSNEHSCETEDPEWKQALEAGRNRLIVRIWKGASRWWNLHQQQPEQLQPSSALAPEEEQELCAVATADRVLPSVHRLARSEVAGYRVARLALHSSTTDDSDENSNSLRIPTVLAFSLELSDNNDDTDDAVKKSCASTWSTTRYPWAVMEYVGAQSTLYDADSGRLLWDDSWTTGMTKIRDEFGFAEPHPRWGRVPVDKCLDYTMAVLRQVTLPLHRYCNQHSAEQLQPAMRGLAGIQTPTTPPTTTIASSSEEESGLLRGYNYLDMVQLYETAHDRMKQVLRHSSSSLSMDTMDANLNRAVELLGKAIRQLHEEAVTLGLDLTSSSSAPSPSLPPVLVHMDCQPQNLLFAQTKEKRWPLIVSVLDWEEAAFADPRFELLLICRKVCANRSQADQVWKAYREELPQPNLGSIEPWLKLETVHSLTTLLLQSMDLLSGGRSPWETKPDLWGKIQREFSRLASGGWEFCNMDALELAATG
jgi:hypothetical protein